MALCLSCLLTRHFYPDLPLDALEMCCSFSVSGSVVSRGSVVDDDNNVKVVKNSVLVNNT